MGNHHVLGLTVFVLIMNWIGCYLVDRNEEICKTNGCKRLAKIVKESIDETIDPCHDFYQFACGGYIERNPLKNHASSQTVVDDMNYQPLVLIANYLKKVPSNQKASLSDKTAYKIFTLCMTQQDYNEPDCARALGNGMGRWLDAFFEEHISGKGSLEDVGALKEKILITYKELIKEDKWVEENTKKALFNYLSIMNYSIAVRTPIWSQEELDRFASIFTPIEKVNTWDAYTDALANFKPGPEFLSWDVEVILDANSENYYGNVTIHFGDLQEPKYALDFPIEWLYGSTGRTIGHEITHSFGPDTFTDPHLPKIKLYGDDYQQYYDRADCVADHFSNAILTVTDHGKNYTFSQNGKQTWAETVSDNMGTRVAFRAYQKEKRRLYGNKESPRLIRLKRYSPEQIFFIGSAIYFCGSESPARLAAEKGYIHPYHKIRVNEGMKDQQTFAKAFNSEFPNESREEVSCLEEIKAFLF